MLVELALPKAFSLREENEFYPVQHLLSRMHPGLTVVQIATGRHVHGGCTVFWGLVFQQSQVLTEQAVRRALEEAGFDFNSGSLQPLERILEPITVQNRVPASR